VAKPPAACALFNEGFRDREFGADEATEQTRRGLLHLAEVRAIHIDEGKGDRPVAGTLLHPVETDPPRWGHQREVLADRVQAHLPFQLLRSGEWAGGDGDQVKVHPGIPFSGVQQGSRSKEIKEDSPKGQDIAVRRLSPKCQDKIGRGLAAPATANELHARAGIGQQGLIDELLELTDHSGCISVSPSFDAVVGLEPTCIRVTHHSEFSRLEDLRASQGGCFGGGTCSRGSTEVGLNDPLFGMVAAKVATEAKGKCRLNLVLRHGHE
jgi:hypothetical protein